MVLVTMSDARDPVVAEAEHAQPRQFPQALDGGNVVPRQVQRVQALGQRSGGDVSCQINQRLDQEKQP